MDMCSAHYTEAVRAFIAETFAEGRLAVGYIDGGLTSAIQVCDLVVNKDLKQMIVEDYYACRTALIRGEQIFETDDC